MGQCYAIYIEQLKIKGVTAEEKLDNEFQLCCAMHDWAKDDSLRIATNNRDLVLSAQTLKDIVEAIFGPYPDDDVPADEHRWLKNGDWSSVFSGSYGWESIMYEAFTKMAPYLAEGSALSCYPDGDTWMLTVKANGSVEETEAELDWEDEDEGLDKVDLFESYFDSYETIVESEDGDYYFAAQGDFSYCLSTALSLYGSSGIANICLDGCKADEENIPLWQNGEWEDENKLAETIRKKQMKVEE